MMSMLPGSLAVSSQFHGCLQKVILVRKEYKPERKKKLEEINFYVGNQVKDKIALGLGERVHMYSFKFCLGINILIKIFTIISCCLGIRCA